jgi:hypothetical protein
LPATTQEYDVPVETTYSDGISYYRGPGERIIGRAYSGRAEFVDDPITSGIPRLTYGAGKSLINYGINSITFKGEIGFVYHSTSSSGAAANILKGINPKYFNSSSRFGGGFYVANSPITASAELAFHNVPVINTIRFELINGNMMNATGPMMNLGVKYAPKQLGWLGKQLGFNGIRYNSLRNYGGINTVLFKNFQNLANGTIIK